MSEDRLLEVAIDELRTPVSVRPAWRQEVLRQVAAAPLPNEARLAAEPRALQPRRLALRPLSALAAALACMVVGLAAGLMVSDARSRAAVAPADAAGNLTAVRFSIVAPSARRVSLVGDFNGWDAAANPLRLSRDGERWIVEVPLTQGRHAYAFVVDGDIVRDPAALSLVDDDFGVPNSIIFVGAAST